MKSFYLIAHGEVYRIRDGKIEFLLIRRTPKEGGWWQPVTGTVEDGELGHEALYRELFEEVGIGPHQYLHVSDELHCRDWEDSENEGTDLVYAVEVAPEVPIRLNPEEHDAYQWLEPEEAIKALQFDGNRESMRQVHTYIQSRLFANT